MLENLQAINVFSPSITEIILNILVSLSCSFVISLVYRMTYKGPGYSNNFVNSFVFLSVITTMVLMIIGNNLARAFGLVGALSIIRFRTAIKDTIDIIYIFLSLTIGMAGGVGYHRLAFTGTAIMGIILILFSKTKGSFLMSKPYMLQFVSYNGKDANGSKPIDDVLSGNCTTLDMINMRTNDLDGSLEYSYYIRMKREITTLHLMDELQKVHGVKNINIYFDHQST